MLPTTPSAITPHPGLSSPVTQGPTPASRDEALASLETIPPSLSPSPSTAHSEIPDHQVELRELEPISLRNPLPTKETGRVMTSLKDIPPDGVKLWDSLFGLRTKEEGGEAHKIFTEVYEQNVGLLGNQIISQVLDQIGPHPTHLSLGSHVVPQHLDRAAQQQLPPDFLQDAANNPQQTYHIVLVDSSFSDGSMPIALQHSYPEQWSVTPGSVSQPVPPDPVLTFSKEFREDIERIAEREFSDTNALVSYLENESEIIGGISCQNGVLQGTQWKGEHQAETRTYSNPQLPNVKITTVATTFNEKIEESLTGRDHVKVADHSGVTHRHDFIR